jgi:hypothetical protein
MEMENNNNKKIPVDEIIKTIRGIKFGQVHITIHNSEVVQIDKIEKIRFEKQNNKNEVYKTSA